MISWKFTRITASFSFFAVGRYSEEKSVKEIWDFGTRQNSFKMKMLMFSPSVKTSYISGNILVFRKLEKNKPKQSELCLVLDLGQFASFGEEC